MLSWAVLYHEKKTSIYYMFSGLESVGVGSSSMGANVGHEMPEEIWQRTPLTHSFCLCVSTCVLNLSHFEKKCVFWVISLKFLFDGRTLLMAPSINTWPDSKGFGDEFNFPTKGLGLVARMFSWAALDAVLNNERRADPGCPISSRFPSPFSKESLLKEALTQIAESCVWNKRSCNKHFRL